MRMGGRLKRLKRDFKGKKLSDGKTIGRQNRLTDNLIDTFQHYYGKVLKGNKVGMIRAVNANWHYYSSIEEEPMHQFCPPKPPGSNSWCKWQNDQVSSKKTFKPKKVDKAVMQEVKPVPNCSFANYNCHREILVDEAMIPFKGRLKIKVRMPDKPVKYGIKFFEL